MHADPKSTKQTDGLTAFFVLLGSELVKAASKMLVKLTPGWVEKSLKIFNIFFSSFYTGHFTFDIV